MTRHGIVRQRKTLSIMPTYTCPAACLHCGSLSSPQERTVLPRAAILRTIDEAAALGFCNVVFTGGEATLRWDDLLAGLRHATALGLPTRLVSNAHWATSAETAAARIEALIAAGLCEINYSTGDEHVRFIPLDRVARAIVAAVERDLPVWVVVELRKERRVTRADLEAHELIAGLPAGQRALLTIYEGPWMPLDPGMVERYEPGLAVDRENLPGRTGCDSVLQTYTLQADGRIAACCGIGQRLIPELTVGRAEGEGALAAAMTAAESDLLKLWVRYLGPEKLLEWARQRDPSIAWEGRYAHHCQACARVYRDPQVARLVREHYAEMVAPIIEAAWLDECELPKRLRRQPRNVDARNADGGPGEGAGPARAPLPGPIPAAVPDASCGRRPRP